MTTLEAIELISEQWKQMQYDYGRLEKIVEQLAAENDKLKSLIRYHRTAMESSSLGAIAQADKELYEALK